MATSCGNPSACAKLVREAAARWGGYAKTAPVNLKKAYRTDAADLRKVAAVVAKGDKAAARAAAWRLDTIVRDEIPESVWCWMSPESVMEGCENGGFGRRRR